jgi:hypothetical protein
MMFYRLFHPARKASVGTDLPLFLRKQRRSTALKAAALHLDQGLPCYRVRSSFSILPSRSRITRWACAAMSGSCVTKMMVLPL